MSLADLVFTDVPGRVAQGGCLTWRTGSASSRRDGLQVHHDLTQEELAQLVGASRETVNKALAGPSRRRGWLQLSAKVRAADRP